MSGTSERPEGEARRAGEDFEAVELIAVARAVKVRGLKGEVVADLLTDFPERFEGLADLIAVAPAGGQRQRLALERHWFQNGRVIFKFKGYDTPETARALVGLELAVPESEAVELEDGEFYDWQLEGCRAETVGGIPLGTVREVLHAGGDSPVLIIHDDKTGREHLVPFVESICVEVDIEGGLIRVDAPEGLIEP